MALVGLLVRTPEVVNNASFIVIFPLTFVANTFVPLETFPSVLRTFAEWNPVSSVVQAARNLFGNSFGAPDVWSLQHPVLYSALWGAVILGVFVPLSVRTYRSTASR
jgi:ABC-type multidrug transport system permease subunit